MNTTGLKDVWVQIIERENWDLYVTITFKKTTSCFSKNKDYTAVEKFKYFFKHLNTYPNEFFSNFIRTLVVYEPFSSGTGIHIHALVKGIPPAKAQLLEEKLTITLGLSVVRIYDPTQNAKFYLAEKISSNKLEDYSIYKINSAIRQKPKPITFSLTAV